MGKTKKAYNVVLYNSTILQKTSDFIVMAVIYAYAK